MIGNGKIFISHTHTDNQRCEPLLAALDAWQVDYWFDVAQLSAGLEFGKHIEEAISKRDVFLRICTDATAGSTWMAKEAEWAHLSHTQKNTKENTIISLILTSGYNQTAFDKQVTVIDTTRTTEVEWLRALRQTLGISSRDQRISRRTVIGLGATTAAALSATGYATKLALTSPPPPHVVYRPAGTVQTAVPQPVESRLRWMYQYGPALPRESFPSQIAVEQQTLYSVNQDAVFSLTTADGTLGGVVPHYQNDIQNFALYQPTITTGTVYISALTSVVNDLIMFALDATSAKEHWRTILPYTDTTNHANTNFLSQVVVVNGIALIRLQNQVVALDAATGKLRWQTPVLQFSPLSVNNIPTLPSPIVVDGVVYAAMTTGELLAFDLPAGWAYQPIIKTQFPLLSAPTVANGIIYLNAGDGYCYAFNARTHEKLWKIQTITDTDLATIATQFPRDSLPFLPSSPTFANGILYIGGGDVGVDLSSTSSHIADYFHAIDAVTGKILWSVQPSKQIIGQNQQSRALSTTPLVTKEAIYVAAVWSTQTFRHTDVLYALDPANGNLIWSYQMRGDISIQASINVASPGQPVIVDTTLYYPSSGGAIYAFSL